MTQVFNLRGVIHKVALALFGLTLLFGVAGNVPALADDSGTNAVGTDGVTIGGTIDPCVFSDTCDTGATDANTGIGGVLGVIFTIVQYAIYVVGAVAVIFLIYGGFLFIVDPGGSGDGASKGKTIIFNALIGLVLVLLATAIVQLVAQIAGGIEIN